MVIDNFNFVGNISIRNDEAVMYSIAVNQGRNFQIL